MRTLQDFINAFEKGKRDDGSEYVFLKFDDPNREEFSEFVRELHGMGSEIFSLPNDFIFEYTQEAAMYLSYYKTPEEMEIAISEWEPFIWHSEARRFVSQHPHADMLMTDAVRDELVSVGRDYDFNAHMTIAATMWAQDIARQIMAKFAEFVTEED